MVSVASAEFQGGTHTVIRTGLGSLLALAGTEPATGADRGECPARQRGLANLVIAPAGDGAVGPHAAGAVLPCADGGEPPRRRPGLRHCLLLQTTAQG